MLKDNALGVRKTLEKTSSEVSQGTTIGLCGKHELQEEIQRVRTVPYGQKAKKWTQGVWWAPTLHQAHHIENQDLLLT